MSVTGMLNYNDEWKKFFKECIPKKSEFKTISGHVAFSNEYKELAEYSLSNKYYSSIVGTAFDYIARWIIAKNVPANRDESCKDLVAEYALETCISAADKSNIDMRDTYERAIIKCRQFIEGVGKKEEIIDIAILFAKMEQIFRRHIAPWDVDMEYLFSCEQEIIDDLEKLYEVFEQTFVASGLVKVNSDVVYNPTFGGASVICGGADADIFIDGVLYDFKCTRKHGYVWNEVAQILAYYLLDIIAKKHEDDDNCLRGYEIKRIAFYRARYGEVEYIDIKSEQYKMLIEAFEEIIGIEKYAEYFQWKKRKEEEKLKREEKRRKLEEEKRLKELKEQEEYNLALKRGNEKEIMLYKIKKYLYPWMQIEGWFEECRNERERKKEIENWYEYYSHTKEYCKIDTKKIKCMLRRNKVTVEEISQYTERSIQTVQKWIKGQSTPNTVTFVKLLEILNCEKQDIVK